MANGLLYVPRWQDWTLSASLSATSEQTGYEAANAATDDPSDPWWANSTTATLTIALGATRTIDVIALIMTNADEGRTITIGGLSGGTHLLAGDRARSGYPRDVALVLDTPETASSITIAVSGNANKVSIGRVVVGLTEQLPENLLLGVTVTPFRQQYSDEFPDFRHDIRFDIGVEGWMVEGDVLSDNHSASGSPGDSPQQQLDDWWSGTLSGYYPTLIAIEPDVYPPMWMRMTMGLPRVHQEAPKITRTHLTFMPMSRGREVVG